MNRFRMLKIWEMFKSDANLQQFDYYMNIDADLFLLKKIEPDPMVTMASAGM